MTDFVPFNRGCQPMLTHATCVDVEDINQDGMSDRLTAHFTGPNDQEYIVKAEKGAWAESWGSGSTVSIEEAPNGFGQSLGRYRVNDQFGLEPIDVDSSPCRVPLALSSVQEDAGFESIVLPSGERLTMAVDRHGLFHDKPVSSLSLTVSTPTGEPRLEVASEGAHGADYEESALATEVGADGSRTELFFTSLPRSTEPSNTTDTGGFVGKLFDAIRSVL